MTSTHATLIGIISVIASTFSSLAISLPVAEDTCSASSGIISVASGKSPTLTLATNRAALLKFDLSSLPAAFNGSNISSAKLKFYVLTAKTPGDLFVSPITSGWVETVSSNTPLPTFTNTVAGFAPASKVIGKRFVTIDVTPAVVAALNGSGPDFGFMLRNVVGQTTIAAKEGPGKGPAAELEIDADLSRDASGSGYFPGHLGVGGDFYLSGLLRQGSETGTAEPAGKGLIIRRIQSTNAALGSAVARTDTLTLERDGTPNGFRLVNVANAGYWVAFARNEITSAEVIYSRDPSQAGTNSFITPHIYFHCVFGDPSGLGHQTEVSLLRNAQGDNVIWTGHLISTFNQ